MMQTLPTDVLRDILDHLDPDYNDSNTRGKHWNPPRNERGARATQADIRQFRLVCRRFADLGAQYLFRTIAHRYNSKSFDRLSNLADHPVYGGYVKKFVYLMPYFYVKGAKDFSEFKEDFRDFHMQVGSYSAVFQEPLHCLEVFEEQQHLMHSGDDLKILKKAMKSFTSLQQVQILSVLGEKDNKLLDLAENYDEWDYVDCQWNPACTHAVKTMIQALDYGRPPIYSFVSPRMSPTSLLRLSPDVQELGLTTWSQLSYLKLNFNHMADRDWLSSELESKISLLSEFFKKLFCNAQNLVELHIGFFPSLPLRLQLEEVFHHAVWPKLRIFGIESWRLTSEELIEIASRHRPTIRGLRLAQIYLREGSFWKDVVISFKDLELEWLSLDTIGYEIDFDRQRSAIPQFDFPDDADASEVFDDDSSFGLGFNISLDGSSSSHGEPSTLPPIPQLPQPQTAMSEDSGDSSSSESHNTDSHSNNPTQSSVSDTDPVHLIPTGIVERPGLKVMGPGSTTASELEDLESMDIDMEDYGETVSKYQMMHWERWVVGRDVYTNKKYNRDL